MNLYERLARAWAARERRIDRLELRPTLGAAGFARHASVDPAWAFLEPDELARELHRSDENNPLLDFFKRNLRSATYRDLLDRR